MCVHVFPVKDVMLELLQQNIKLNSSARGILIDGYPRTMQQVEQYQMHVRIFSHMLCMVQSINQVYYFSSTLQARFHGCSTVQ